MVGSCHCGKVIVTLARSPDYINLCDCSLCRKSGGAWGYFRHDDVDVIGQTRSYRRNDAGLPKVEMHFCDDCGTTSHWHMTECNPGPQVGVNMRLFDPAALRGTEVRTLDGANWPGTGPASHRRPHGIYGEDVFL